MVLCTDMEYVCLIVFSQVEREPHSVSDRRRQRSTARKSFQATYEQAVNSPEFAPVLQMGGCVLILYF